MPKWHTILDITVSVCLLSLHKWKEGLTLIQIYENCLTCGYVQFSLCTILKWVTKVELGKQLCHMLHPVCSMSIVTHLLAFNLSYQHDIKVYLLSWVSQLSIYGENHKPVPLSK